MGFDSGRKSKNIKIRFCIRICVAVLAVSVLLITLLTVYGSSLNFYSRFGISSKADIGQNFVCFFDVGEGDSALISSNGESMLIDTGTAQRSKALSTSLNTIGVKSIDYLLVSHFHDDHTGSLVMLTDRFEIKNLILPDISDVDSQSEAEDLFYCREKITSGGGKVSTANVGMNIYIGDFRVEIIYYDTAANSKNDRSVIVMLYTSAGNFLFTADASYKTEKAMAEAGVALDCDVLKVGHHGSRTSACDEFLKACTPEYAVISCGIGNMNSHPYPDTVKRIENIHASVYRTDTDGDVTFFVNNNSFRIYTRG